MRQVLRTRVITRLLPWVLLSAAACSDTEHRLGGAFPNVENSAGASGFGANDTEAPSAGATAEQGGSSASSSGRTAAGGQTLAAGNDGNGQASAGSLGSESGTDGGGTGGEPRADRGGASGSDAGTGGRGGVGSLGGSDPVAGAGSGAFGGGGSSGGASGSGGVLLHAVAIAVGPTNTCALLNSKAVRCWGGGFFGQNGYGNTDNIGDNETPASAGDIDLGGPVKQVAVGDAHACALLEDGAVRCWGQGRYGKLGYGNTNNIGDDETPASAGDVNVGGKVVQLSMGRDHSCALLDTGAVRCWGNNDYGQLGHGNTAMIGDDEPPSVAGDAIVGGIAVQVSAGDSTTCALLSTGNVRCWGQGFYGELGYANTNNVGDNEAPASVGDVNIGELSTQISVGGNHTCALLASGNVRCWGVGSTGELGYANTNWIGDDEAPATAGNVDIGGHVAEIAAGTFPTCARLIGGNVRCWGDGAHVGGGFGKGGLGYGNTNNIGDNETPASVGDVALGGVAIQIAATFDHVCALLTTGGVRCWGSSAMGELGYGNLNAIGDDEVPAAVGDVPLTFPGELVGGGAGGGGAGGGSGGSPAGAGSGGSGGSVSSSGASGNTATAGSSGSGGGKCVGGCSLFSVNICSSVPQCMVAGTCYYFGGATLCGQHTTESSCSAAQWCVWVGGSLGCRTSAAMCPTLYPSEASCKSSAAASSACGWQATGCVGTLDCSQSNDEQACNATAGCSWASGAPAN